MSSEKRKVAVLISGRGSNLAALLDACAAQKFPARIVLVVSNRPDAGGLAHAKEHAIPTQVIDHKSFGTKDAFEAKLDSVLRDAAIDFVCLAGFMRLLSSEFVEKWRDRLLNIHPSLLPLFPGLNTHERALAAGMKLHGATVHFVRAETDTGPIIAQGAVPVLPDDTPETLAARVLTVEHRLYPLALRLVASGAARAEGESVTIVGATAASTASLLSPPEEGPLSQRERMSPKATGLRRAEAASAAQAGEGLPASPDQPPTPHPPASRAPSPSGRRGRLR